MKLSENFWFFWQISRKIICVCRCAVQVGFVIAPKAETTLQEMLVMGLDKYLDELMEISGRAAKEFSLEKVNLITVIIKSNLKSLAILVD